MKLKEFVKEFGQPFSQTLEIDLKSGKNEEILKWFLASILYGKPIRETIATKTCKLFEKRRVITPGKILQTGWDGIVSILDEGGYTRYDYNTADRMLQIFSNLQKDYSGDLSLLHASASSSSRSEERLKNLGKGIGDTTVAIFLRDLRGVWCRADPNPSPLVKAAMQELGIDDLKEFAKINHLNIVRLETGIAKIGKRFHKEGKDGKSRHELGLEPFLYT